MPNFWKATLYSFFIFLETTAFGQQVNTEPKAYSRLDTNAMLIGDKGNLHLSVELNSGEHIVSISPDMPLDTPHLEIQNLGKWDMQNRSLKLMRDIAFIAWDSGLYRINPIVFTIQMADGNIRTVESPPILLTVNNPKGASEQLAPMGIKDIVKEDLAWEDVMPYIVGCILALGLSFLAYVGYKKWKNRNVLPVVQKIVQPPYIIAERLLQELNAKKLWQQGKIKEFYSELSHILRGYLEDQFSMLALESTTDQLISTLRKKQFEDGVINKIKGLLQTADLVKFAKVEPATDAHDRFWHDAVAVVELTKPKPIVENQEVDSVNK